jgi:cytochrome c oxidase subunit IV
MKTPSLATLVITWLGLLALLAATAALANVPMGTWNTAASFSIAALKGLLVALFFMHLRRASALIALFAAAGLLWLAVLFGLGAADLAAGEASPAPWSAPE